MKKEKASWQEYKGVEITLDDGGYFVATVNGVRERKPSVDTIQACIKNGLLKKFEPFNILMEEHGKKGGFVSVRIVAHDKGDSRNRLGGAAFVAASGERHRYAYALDTAENRVAYSRLLAFQKESERIKDEREKEHERLQGLVVRVRPRSKAWIARHLPAYTINNLSRQPENVRDFLSLVLHGELPSVEEIAAWTPEKHLLADDWAMCQHLAASDNNVRVPAVPEFLRRYRDQ